MRGLKSALEKLKAFVKQEFENLELDQFPREEVDRPERSQELQPREVVRQLEEAVRWIIVLLIFVFDPLAVVLVIAANISLRDYRKEKKMATKTVTVMPDLSDKEIIDKENVSEYSDDEGNDFKILTWDMFKKLSKKGDK